MNKKILVIEDDVDIRSALESFLKMAGPYDVVVKENGQEGLNFLSQNSKLFSPDLIFLDIMMPVMNGLEFLKTGLSLKELKKFPVVLMSATNHIKELKEVTSNHFEICHFLKKPLDLEELHFCLTQYIKTVL